MQIIVTQSRRVHRGCFRLSVPAGRGFDAGPGISFFLPQALKQLFQPYEQAVPLVPRRFGGTGWISQPTPPPPPPLPHAHCCVAGGAGVDVVHSVEYHQQQGTITTAVIWEGSKAAGWWVVRGLWWGWGGGGCLRSTGPTALPDGSVGFASEKYPQSTGGGRLLGPGTRPPPPPPAWTRRREVKQGKSGGSVGTTDQGKGKGRSVVRPMGTVAYRGKGQGKGKGRGEGRLGQGGRGRSKGGEKLMGTTAYGGKGSKGRAANGDRPVGAASCRRDHHTMASCQTPPPPPPGPPGPLSYQGSMATSHT